MPDLGPVTPARRACVVLAQDGGLVLSGARWGLVPTWVECAASFKLSLTQADIETAHTDLYYRRAFERRRCLVAVEAMTLWARVGEGVGNGADVRPATLRRRDGAGFLLAGLYERRSVGDRAVLSFALLSAAAGVPFNQHCARQPAVLRAEGFRSWLEGSVPGSVPGCGPDEADGVWADMEAFCWAVG